MHPVTDEFVHLTPITQRAQGAVQRLVPLLTEEERTSDACELAEYWRIMGD